MSQTVNRSASGKPDDVPKASKLPKSRPPAGFREYVLRTPLPHYSGPYSVGMMDIEVPARNPRHFSEIKRDHRHLLELQTVLFSVYYPTGFGSSQGKSPKGERRWTRPTWLPHPRVELAKGYGKFAGVPSYLSVPWFGVTTAFTKIPAYRNSKLAEHWPAEMNSRDAGTYQVKNKAGKPPPGQPEMPCFPLLLFSHGLGGTRTTYSSVCGEFASYGFIVVALEHRDGSGPRTFVNLPKDKGMENGNVASTEKANKKYSRMDYIFPENNAYDTSPGNEQGVDADLRAAQIQLRLAELEEAYHIMTLIRDGRGEEVAKSSLRQEKVDNIGGSSRGLRGIDWAAWKGRFYIQQVTMLGHSFGAATTIEVLRHKDRFPYIGQGIIYDIWGAAVQHPEAPNCIKCPLLGINSEAFMYWPNNFETVMSLCKEVKKHDQLCWLMTVRGSVHISQSDFSLLYPRLASLWLKMTVNPRRAIDLNINASLEFLGLVMPDHFSKMNRGTNEHLLDLKTLEKLPQEHQPDEKWMAVRLRIPHEFRIRVVPSFMRNYMRRKHTNENSIWPRDPKGNPLVGLEELQLGEEVWMHVAPTREELKAHGIQGRGTLAGDDEGDGMVEVTGDEGKEAEQNKGIEQKYMERG